jgi:hypothetical protein
MLRRQECFPARDENLARKLICLLVGPWSLLCQDIQHEYVQDYTVSYFRSTQLSSSPPSKLICRTNFMLSCVSPIRNVTLRERPFSDFHTKRLSWCIVGRPSMPGYYWYSGQHFRFLFGETTCSHPAVRLRYRGFSPSLKTLAVIVSRIISLPLRYSSVPAKRIVIKRCVVTNVVKEAAADKYRQMCG